MEEQTENQSRFHWLKKLPIVPLLFFVGAFIAYRGLHGKSAEPNGNGGQASDSAPASQSHGYFKTHFQTESQFIIESILTDIAEMCWFAKTHTPPEPGKISAAAVETPDSQFDAPKYQITISSPNGQISTALEVHGPIWSPEVYTNAAQLIFKEFGVKSPQYTRSGGNDTAMLKELLELTAINIETQNKNLSDALGQDFMNPALHEKAAALMAIFALRDSSGDFFDIRPPLNRVTAHLTMAKVLATGSPFGPNGAVAEAALLSLINDQKDALKKAAALDANIPELAAWSRTICAQTTHDYRPLAAAGSRSTAEGIAWFKAYAYSVDVTLAWEKMSAQQKSKLPDLCRFAQNLRHSVGLGHVLSEIRLSLEMKEFGDVCELARGARPAKKDFISLLNEMPEGCFSIDANKYRRVRVIGWGQWAAFGQRHICHAMQRDFDFYQRMWGVPEEARKFSSQCDEVFSGLRLYPFVRRFNCLKEHDYQTSIDDGLRVTQETPQLVPVECWNYMCFEVPFAAPYKPNPNPHINEWHNHNPLPGTAYDFIARTEHPSFVQRGDYANRLSKLHERAPYDEVICRAFIDVTYKDRGTLEQEKAAWGPLLQFNSHVMNELAARKLTHDPVAYEAMVKQAATLDPDYYFSLGEFFVNRKDDAKTILYLQNGTDLSSDAVTASAYAGPLIKAYLRAGATNQAAKIADFAAEVYSYDGLIAKADFLEAMGRYSEALNYYKMIEERYSQFGATISFCQRYKAKTGKTDFDVIMKRRLLEIFPGGLENVMLNSFKQPPTDGVRVSQVNSETEKVGLNACDIIVAVQGIHVHNFDQYCYARETKNTPELTLIIWQNNHYREVVATPPNHRFGVSMGTFAAK